MGKAIVTVIMPHYNYGQFFPEAFESLIRQTRKPDNIVIVDDCSTDGSTELVLNYLHKNSVGKNAPVVSTDNQSRWSQYNEYQFGSISVRFYQSRKNGGRAAACNIAITESISYTTVYAILDCDDIYWPEKIAKSLTVMERYPEVAIVYSDLEVWNMAKNEKKRDFYRSFDFSYLSNRNICNNNSMVSKRAYELVGLYDEELTVAEDYDMWLRIAEIGAIYHIPETLFTYRVSGLNESITTKPEVWQKCLTRLHQKKAERQQSKMGRIK